MVMFYDRTQLDVTARGLRHLVGVAGIDTALVKTGELCGFFDGVNTLLDYAAEHLPEPRRDEASAQVNEGSFNSFATYDEAMRTYRHDPSKVRGFTEADLTLSDRDSAGLGVTYDVTGDYLDVGRYLEGEPEAFGVMADGNPRSRRVNLLVNMDWVCTTTADLINARGRRLQRLVDWLEARSVRTSITAVSSAECAHIEVLLKGHDEVLDLNDLAIVGHGDFFRRIAFRFMEYSRTWRGGYGSPLHLNAHLRGLAIDADFNELPVIVSNQIDDVSRLDAEFDKVEHRLAKVLSATAYTSEPPAPLILFSGGS